MSEHAPITGEIRERIRKAEHIVPLTGEPQDMQVRINLAWLKERLDAIDAIHASLERENDRLRCDLDRVQGEQDGWIRLPVDADGENIHIGEAMEGADGYLGSVWLVGVNEVMFDNHIVRYANTLRHYQPDSWEGIIYDAIQAGRTDVTMDVTPLIKRCKALCERTNGGDAE